MNRRSFIVTTGASVSAALAGCNETSGSQGQNENGQESGEGGESSQEELGQPTPMFSMLDIDNITDDTLTVDLYPRSLGQSFSLNVYESISEAGNAGEWELINYAPDTHPNNPKENDDDWRDEYYDNSNKSLELRYEDHGEEIHSFEFEEVSGGWELEPESEHASEKSRITHEEYDHHHVWSLDIPISTPPTNQPFAYTFSVEDYTNHDQSIEASTQPIIRLSNGEFVYPSRPSGGSYSGQSPAPDWGDDMVQNVKDGSKRRIVRATGETRFREYYEHGKYDRIPKTGQMLNSERLRQWSIDYEITDEDIEEATSDAEPLTTETEENRVDLRDMKRIVQDENHHDNKIIREVGDKLHEQCEYIGATSNIEKVRVLADFVQHIEYEHRPTTTPAQYLKDMRGDCKHSSMLMFSLLQHEKFDIDTTFPFVDFTKGDFVDSDIGAHIAIGVNFDDIEEEGPLLDQIDEPLNSFYGRNGSYLYIECTEPYPLGSLEHNYIFDELEYVWE